ncbi:hypothetical protein L1987_72935 [Smallanthus sonchifolius]|uniref:Uncharacterized protein n=1 Tax=Smallanthus sonchifolius TaxID=185202 RepID=A0ACB9AXA9_9ASTR|nr:hypothetical protein L1987_72935 [Smallanthus sonchifolius]
MEGSTSNPRQQGDQDQISQSPQDYTNLDGDENQDVPQDQNVNEDASVEEVNRGGEEDVQLKRKRQKKSTVWGDFIEVTLPDGTEKVECIHCKTRLAISTWRPTSTWKRHMDGCLKRKQYLRTQQLLNFQCEEIPCETMTFVLKEALVKSRSTQFDGDNSVLTQTHPDLNPF